MSAFPAFELPPVQRAAIVPHCTTASAGSGRGPGGLVSCPRCHHLVTLPTWARDGDLTECCGLLLRISREGNTTWLEQL